MGPNEEYVERPAPLPGYRTLTEDEIKIVNPIKTTEQAVAAVWAEVRYRHTVTHDATKYALQAEAQLRDGFMNLVRTVTRPRDPYTTAFDEILERDER